MKGNMRAMTVVLSLLATAAWGQTLQPGAGHVSTLESVVLAQNRAVTRGGQILRFDPAAAIMFGSRELSGREALKALAPGMSVQLLEVEVQSDGALAVKRLEVVPK